MPSNPRRLMHGSGESYQPPLSPTFVQDATDSMTLLGLLEPLDTKLPIIQLPALSDHDLELKRLLSVRTIVSTSSSNAQRQAKAQLEKSNSYTKIGAGSCGAIFSREGQSIVLKLAKNAEHNLWNDYKKHTRILEKINDFNIDIKMTKCYYFISDKDGESYFDLRPDLTAAAKDIVNLPTDVLATQRINALPETTRVHLINKFCAPRIRSKALADPANKDCLVRIYLGSLAGKTGGMFFSLRNFKLHLNQIIDLQLDVSHMAVQIAKSLAVMHWAARTDARDVEFVLGSSPEITTRSPALTSTQIESFEEKVTTGPATLTDEDFFHRSTELFLLDFNLVRDIELNESCIEKLVNAHNANDPYYPKPCQDDLIAKQLWNEFVKAYLDTAAIALRQESVQVQMLPGKFLSALVSQERAKQQEPKDTQA